MGKKNYSFVLLTGRFLFPTLAARIRYQNPLPTVPVNCYGKDSCIQAVAYADTISIQVDATRNNLLTPFVRRSFFHLYAKHATILFPISRLTFHELHHFLYQSSQHHQPVVNILAPRLSKTDADKMSVIAVCRKDPAGHNRNLVFHCLSSQFE